ncbi:MAG: conjugative transposon protein TraM, partial [Prevotella sp.]|nr:conjugative transposon protein TraM [Prevotella sp.]
VNEILSKIKGVVDFKQTKYRLALVLFPLILFTAYFTIKAFQVDLAETKGEALKSTDFLNPELPQAQLSGRELTSRREALENAFGNASDYSAVEGIEKEQTEGYTLYESQYTEEEMEELASNTKEKETQMEEALKKSSQKAEAIASGKEEAVTNNWNNETERLKRSERAQNEAIKELEKALTEARLGGQKGLSIDVDEKGNSLNSGEISESALSPNNANKDGEQTSSSEQGNLGLSGSTSGQDKKMNFSKGKNVNEKSNKAVHQAPESLQAKEVAKKVNPNSAYFSTIKENETTPLLIRAIIDEEITAVENSRVRLRLLDAIEIEDVVLEKGTYLYAKMSGFSSQRVRGTIENILAGDELLKVSLTIYDLDGQEGLYVPQSAFRDAARDVLSDAATTNVNIGSSSYSNSFSSWGMQTAQNAYNRIANAVSRNIKKNKAKLKYGSKVYLVNKK